MGSLGVSDGRTSHFLTTVAQRTQGLGLISLARATIVEREFACGGRESDAEAVSKLSSVWRLNQVVVEDFQLRAPAVRGLTLAGAALTILPNREAIAFQGLARRGGGTS